MNIDNSIFDNLEDIILPKNNLSYNFEDIFILQQNDKKRKYYDDPAIIHENLLKSYYYYNFNNFVLEKQAILMKKENDLSKFHEIKKANLINELYLLGNETLKSTIYWRQQFDHLMIEYKKLYYLINQIKHLQHLQQYNILLQQRVSKEAVNSVESISKRIKKEK